MSLKPQGLTRPVGRAERLQRLLVGNGTTEEFVFYTPLQSLYVREDRYNIIFCDAF